MANDAKILYLTGSARAASLNRRVAGMAGRLGADAGADTEFIDPRDYPMPLYDGDLEDESGVPAGARALREKFIAADGAFLVCPEYNSSITPLLKNTIDWLSRGHPDDPHPMPAFRGKVFALAAVSPGGLGGIRMLPTVRQILTVLGGLVIAEQVGIGRAGEVLDDDGSELSILSDPIFPF